MIAFFILLELAISIGFTILFVAKGFAPYLFIAGMAAGCAFMMFTIARAQL